MKGTIYYIHYIFVFWNNIVLRFYFFTGFDIESMSKCEFFSSEPTLSLFIITIGAWQDICNQYVFVIFCTKYHI